ncbi:MAG: cupin domain-containing protein [Myxococcales bacterium]
MGYQVNVHDATLANEDFRRVLYTTDKTQLVVMSVLPGEDIGLETHDLDQVLVFVSGTGEALLNGQRSPIKPGDVVVVPTGTEHNFINTGDEPLKLYTVYSPPEHPPGTVHLTRADAERAEAMEHAEKRQLSALTVGSLRHRP